MGVDLPPTVEENGFVVGPVAGVDVPVGPFDIFIGGEFLWLSMSNFQLAMGPGLGGEGDSGWRYSGEVGLRFTTE